VKKQDFEKYIKEFRHKELFIDLGWDIGKSKLSPIEIDSILFQPEVIVEKSGFRIIICNSEVMPLYPIRLKIANNIKKQISESIIIFTAKPKQVWFYSYLDGGRSKTMQVEYNNNQDTERLYQRASGLIFKLEEQDDITIVDVYKRVNDNFAQNTEKVTKKFYDGFKKQHTALLKFIEGIEAKLDKEWYASIMLNRLMFCYFMQRRGFLDNKPDYLSYKLKECKSKLGKDSFYSFYRSFLCRLFREGFGEFKHNQELIELIGKIPYLNGGLFELHEIENKNPDINIADEAFDNIFALFDTFEWYLDTRECSSGNEISPDVLGYIFEKYINDRAEMGAYYTKEDITDYIGRNTILPYLLESTKTAYSKAFEPNGDVWTILRDSKNDYIFESVKKGVDEPLPPNIAVGIDTQADNLLERRKDWNQVAPPECALPTEIWREVIERRKKYEEVSSLIKQGKIVEINDFITYNLNITDFVKYLLGTIEDPKFIQEFYKNLCKISILDPTCGSGAFLFAALNILEPLYDVCLNRMSDYLSHDYKGILDKNIRKFFEENLKLMENEIHPDKTYFIYKSIILNNLYGVDIMREAVETAKLRLFLKLVSTTEPKYDKENIGIEPLPDIDFNIKSGNTLIGFAKLEDVRDALANSVATADRLLKDRTMEDIEKFAKAINLYKDLQLGKGDYKSNEFATAKKELSDRQVVLKNTLDKVLRERYYPTVEEEDWRKNYMPFHWVAEFYAIIVERKGFDVIIGNPPYVKYNKKSLYQIKNYETEKSKNIYAYTIERSFSLLLNNGYCGYIIPISSISNPEASSFQELISTKYLWQSSYSNRPAKLFKDVEQRLTILIMKNGKKHTSIYNASYVHWYSKEREKLFEKLYYISGDNIRKIGNLTEQNIFKKILTDTKPLKMYPDFFSKSKYICYFHDGPTYWIRAMSFNPRQGYESDKSNHYKEICCSSERISNLVTSLLNSSTFYFFFKIVSNCRDFTMKEVEDFRINDKILNFNFDDICAELMKNYIDNRAICSRLYDSGHIDYYEYYPKSSKEIIDKIDSILAKHYDFSPEELDYIINYDIKYRIGSDIGESNGE